MQNGNWGYWLGWTCLDRPLHFPIWRVQWVQWLGSPPSPKTCTSNILTSAAATIRFPWKIQFTRNKWIGFFSGNIKKFWLLFRVWHRFQFFDPIHIFSRFTSWIQNLTIVRKKMVVNTFQLHFHRNTLLDRCTTVCLSGRQKLKTDFDST